MAAQFGAGSEVAKIAAIFEGVDSFLMPLVVTWSGGPGKMRAKDCPKGAAADEKFAFVGQLATVGQSVTGAANKDRFAYWLATFKYMQAIDATSCAWGAYNKAVKNKSAVVPAYNALLTAASTMILQLQQTLSNVSRCLACSQPTCCLCHACWL